MSIHDDQTELMLGAMMARVGQAFPRMGNAGDERLIRRFMEVAYVNGFRADELRAFKWGKTRAYGISRDQTHFVGVVAGREIYDAFPANKLALMANTTGALDGLWHFATEACGSLLMAMGGQECTRLGTLSGQELMEAVWVSVLTAPESAPAADKRRRFRFPGLTAR